MHHHKSRFNPSFSDTPDKSSCSSNIYACQYTYNWINLVEFSFVIISSCKPDILSSLSDLYHLWCQIQTIDDLIGSRNFGEIPWIFIDFHRENHGVNPGPQKILRRCTWWPSPGVAARRSASGPRSRSPRAARGPCHLGEALGGEVVGWRWG